MIKGLAASFEARYEGRSRLERLRVTSMFATYAFGLVGALVMIAHDLYFEIPQWELKVGNSACIALTMVTCLGLAWRGRDRAASRGVLVITLLFTAFAVLDRGAGEPERYYDTFARWYPVFIVATVLLAQVRVSIGVAALSIGLNFGYWFAFCVRLPQGRGEQALGDAIEMSAINLLIGVMTAVSMRLVRDAFAEAEGENKRSRRLRDELEDRVLERTQELSSAFSQRQAILENLADGLLAIDADGTRIELANPAFQVLTETYRDLTGESPAEVLPPELCALIERAAEQDATVVRDLPLPGDRVARTAVFLFHAEGGEMLGRVVVMRDVTLELEVDRMKTDFISTVSHELRTPLTSVRGFAQLIRNQLERRVFQHVPEDDARGQKAVKRIRENVGIIISEGTRLTELINDVLDISKMEAGRMEYRAEPVGIRGLVEQACDATRGLFDEQGPRLVAEVDEDVGVVTGDTPRLLQVLVNLLSNARKFTDEGSVTVRATRVGERVRVEVQDTGEGVPEAMRAGIFERFRQIGETLTDKPRGTGLGLPICRQIVQAHGSEIELTSEVGVGSTFAFTLRARASGDEADG